MFGAVVVGLSLFNSHDGIMQYHSAYGVPSELAAARGFSKTGNMLNQRANYTLKWLVERI